MNAPSSSKDADVKSNLVTSPSNANLISFLLSSCPQSLIVIDLDSLQVNFLTSKQFVPVAILMCWLHCKHTKLTLSNPYGTCANIIFLCKGSFGAAGEADVAVTVLWDFSTIKIHHKGSTFDPTSSHTASLRNLYIIQWKKKAVSILLTSLFHFLI